MADGGTPADVWPEQDDLAAGTFGGVAITELDDQRLVDAAVATQRGLNRLAAVQLEVVATLARRRVAADARDAVRERPGHVAPAEAVGAELACALVATRRASSALVELATGLDRLPTVAAALRAGELDVARARVLVRATTGLSDATAGAVIGAVLPRARRLTPAGLAAAARGAVRAHDPAALEARFAQAAVARRVSVSHDSDGHSRLVAEGPIHQIQRLAAAVDAAAHVLPAAGRSVAQRRFDALVAMAAGVLDEVATGDRLAGRAGIVVRGSADTLDRLRGAKRGADTADDSSADEAEPAQDARTARPRKRSKETESAELAGYGPIPDSLARMLLMDRHASVLVTGISQPVCDHSGGYAIPDGLVSAVLALHPRCAFPGCTISSHRADLDHVVPYPTGPTCACNLVPLCRSHHRLKTNGGWRLVLRPGRLAAWRSPLGRRYIVHPSGETDVDMAVA